MKKSRAEHLIALLIVCLVALCVACARTQLSGKENGGPMGLDDDKAPVNYVALGDSTGVGVGAEGGGYVARLFERIEAVRPASRLTNLCVSGATTDDLLRTQIAPAARAAPTLLTIGIGTNDLHRGVPVETFARNYEEIITRLRATTNAPIVVTNLPDVSLAPAVAPALRDDVQRRILLFNERINEIAARHNLLVVDAYAATHDVFPSHPEYFSTDNFHPSDAGYEYWAETMWPTVKRAIGE